MTDDTNKQLGASVDEWLAFGALAPDDLLPLVCDTSRPVSEHSKLSPGQLGKIPTLLTGAGEVVGIGKWTERKSNPADLAKWQAVPDYGICLQTRNIVALDVDCDDPGTAADVLEFLDAAYPHATIRTRAGAPRFVMLFRVDEPVRKAVVRLPGDKQQVELLGMGQQVVVAGTHPKGARYEWPRGLPSEDNVPNIAASELAEMLRTLSLLYGDGEAVELTPNLPAKVDEFEALMSDGVAAGTKPDLDERTILRTCEHNSPIKMSYDDWLDFVAALHLQYDGTQEGLDLAIRWSSGGFHGQVNPAHKEDDLARRYASFGSYSGKPKTLLKFLPPKKLQIDWTDRGLAAQAIDRFGDRLMRVKFQKGWHVWSGSVWQPASEGDELALVCDTLDHTRARGHEEARNKKESDNVEKNAFRYRNYAGMSAVRKALHKHVALEVDIDRLDAEPFTLCAPNGTIDLTTGDLLDPDPKRLQTRQCGAAYDPSVNADYWEGIVRSLFPGDAELYEYFRLFMGYSICGAPDEQLIAILIGEGANGKSMVMECIKAALGKLSASVSGSTITSVDGSSGGAREDLTRLRGVRLALVNELDSGSKLKEATLKKMTGGDTIEARGLYETSTIEFEPVFVPVLRTNHLPRIQSLDNGTWRRLRIFPFERDFTRDPAAVPGLQGKVIKGHLQEVLLWLVNAARDYLAKGLPDVLPASMSEPLREYRRDMNPLEDWVDESLTLDPEAFTSSGELWASWQDYAQAEGLLASYRSQRAMIDGLKRTLPRGVCVFGKRRLGEGARKYGFAGVRISVDQSDIARML